MMDLNFMIFLVDKNTYEKIKSQIEYKYVKVWMIIVHAYVIFKAFQIN